MLKKLKTSIIKRSEYFKHFFYKRDDKIILFGSWSGNKFACNARYLFQYLSENKDALGLKHVVWVTRDRKLCTTLKNMGYEVYEMASRESEYFHKRAGYHIVCNDPFSDINGTMSIGAKCINLWHGLPLKSFGYASNEYKHSHSKCTIGMNIKSRIEPWGEFYLLSTTPYVTSLMDKCFRLQKHYYIESAYPRNCDVIRLTHSEENVLNIISKYKYSVLYLPTFRTKDNKFDFSSFAKLLCDELEDNNILWIQKTHSKDKQNKLQIGLDGNILTLSPEFDINTLLSKITLCITDYSSVMFDAMYHNKPVLYLIPDIEDYKKGDRGLNLTDPNEVMCGPIFMNVNDLKKDLYKYCKNPDSAKNGNYQLIRQRYWGNQDKSLEFIWLDIKNKVK